MAMVSSRGGLLKYFGKHLKRRKHHHKASLRTCLLNFNRSNLNYHILFPPSNLTLTRSVNTYVYNIACKSRAGAMPGKPVKINQDIHLVKQHLMQNPDYAFYAVCDGHGMLGHLVSNYVKKVLPKNIENELKRAKANEKTDFH